jgi:hypothetical protein
LQKYHAAAGAPPPKPFKQKEENIVGNQNLTLKPTFELF